MMLKKLGNQYDTIRMRLANDFRLSIIMMFCIPAATAIGGFGVYRFLQGDWVMTLVDALLVAVLISISGFVWITGNTVVAGILLVICTGIGVLTVLYLVGLVGLFWAYVDIIATFFLSPPAFAIPKALLMVVASVALGAANGLDPLALISFATTVFVVSIFAFSFARRSRAQARLLEEQAIRDPLTGAGNRRALEEELCIAIARVQRGEAGAGLLMLDLDHFKEINDRYGHANGDEVLKQFAELVRTHSRHEDRLFRFGGEEFVLLLNSVRAESMILAARHIQQTIRDRLSIHAHSVTCSIGAALAAPHDDWESWLHRADNAVYEAKTNGRDTIIVADHLPAERC
ncbi:GGDEF domain-containing protein [Vreelandella utahensis]|uniref:GGDEF domain-containing protein n=1 Tax=Vreelandella halophila TaxID=86177 RepID=UPI0009840BD7|nr:GGDEF domain-containing protein [Halomonas utahensis]